ncbi:hypothetical protein BT93_F1177 [Corymbia citriodora subsp. variegata]|nr:hypothetical protein BT93_F1177 [Corymbia citriodora subsp. variegata]
MNRAFSLYALFLILFLIFQHVQSANNIVHDTCKKIKAGDTDLNFDYCVKSLESNPESHKADLKGLGLIGLELLQGNLTSIVEYIEELLKQKWEPRLRDALSLCLDVYSTNEGQDQIPAYKAKLYDDVGSWASSVMTDEDTCDTQESQNEGMVPPLTKRNNEIVQLSTIVLGVLAILQGE